MIGFLLLLTTMPQIASVMAQTAPLTQDNVKILENLPGRDDVNSGWVDSYSVENVCYCFSSNYDHGIGDVLVDTPFGVRTVRQACELLGPGPGSQGRPLYNDIQVRLSRFERISFSHTHFSHQCVHTGSVGTDPQTLP